MSDLDARVAALEQWRGEMRTARAVDDEKQKAMDGRFDRIEKRLDGIEGTLSKIVWLIVAAIIGAVMTFALKGGFSI